MNMKRASKPILMAAVSALVASGVGVYSWDQHHRPKQLEIYVFDVKGSPAFLLRTPDDLRIVIDGGANSDIIRHITSVLPFYSRHIDSVIATAALDSRVSGLVDVVDRYDVGSAYLPSPDAVSAGIASTTDPAYAALRAKLSEKHIIAYEVGTGDTIALGSTVSARVLFPQPADKFPYSKASPPEMILQISFGQTSVAIFGAASKKVQKAIASASSTIERSDVLIISSSAAADSLSTELMDELDPQTLIYSKAVTKSSAIPSKASKLSKPTKNSPVKKKKAGGTAGTDPLAGILESDRLNIRERGVIRIVSDGNTVKTI